MTKTLTSIAVVLGLLLLGTACDKGSSGGGSSGPATPESLAQEQIGLMKEMVAVIKTIQDEPSKKAAIPKLAAINKRGKEITKQIEAMKPTTQQKDALEAKFNKEAEDLLKQIGEETQRLAAKGINLGEVMSEAEKN
jgi:hypothetical protein